MDWARAQIGSDESVLIPKSWLSLHYFEALNLLFRIENSLRVFTYAVLKVELGSKWADASIASEEEGGVAAPSGTIQSLGKRRLNQAKAFGYLGYVSPSPLLYLSMGELAALIFSDAYWKHFAPFFVGTKATMKMKLDEINAIRNALAHFRPLKEDDTDVIRQNAKHAMMGIEKFLSGLTQCADVVPSNSEEGWYKELRALGGEYLQFQLKQNQKRDWIEVNIAFTSPVLANADATGSWRDYRLAKLDSPAILGAFPALRENAIYLTESQAAFMQESGLVYKKWLSFVFARKVMEAKFDEIAASFKSFIIKMNSELELLAQDNLAKGELLSVSQIWAWWVVGNEKQGTQGHWSINIDALSSIPGDDSPPEYWGNLGWLGREFITKREKYPWMASNISGVEF